MGRDSLLENARDDSTSETTDDQDTDRVNPEPEPGAEPDPEAVSEAGDDSDESSEDDGSDEKKFTMRMQEDLVDDIDAFAEQYGIATRAAAMRFLIRDRLSEEDL